MAQVIRPYMHQGADHEIFSTGRDWLFGGAEKVFSGVGMDQTHKMDPRIQRVQISLRGHRAEVAPWGWKWIFWNNDACFSLIAFPLLN